MSLVNDMLRDLDARDPSDRPKGTKTFGGLKPPAHETRGYGQSVLTILAATALVVVGASGYWLMAGKDDAAATVVPGPAIPVTEIAPEQQNGGSPALRLDEPELALKTDPGLKPALEPERPEAAKNNAKKSLPEADENTQLRYAVGQILTSAEQALAEDRLTQPPVNNAHAYFRHALLLQPDNQQALDGLERIRQRYEELALGAIDARAFEDAKRYIERVDGLGLSAERLAALAAALDNERQVAAAAQRSVQAEPAVADQRVQPAATDAASEPAAEVAEAGQGSIARSWRSRESAVLDEAARYAEQGQQARAIAQLENFVAAHAQADGAALMLFDLYLQTGSTEQATAMLPTANSTALRHYFQAKLLVQSGDNKTAGMLLEQAQPDERIRQPYLALQGALYQRNGQYNRAVGIYRQLVDRDNRQPSYWLGLGVAAEAAQQKAQALQAFVAADQLPPISPAVSRYVKERIAVLSER